MAATEVTVKDPVEFRRDPSREILRAPADASNQMSYIPIRAAYASRDLRRTTMKLLLPWLLSAIALLIVSRLIPGFVVTGVGPALIAALVIGLLNATVGLVLKIITFPISI